MLTEALQVLNQNPNLDIIYFDEDRTFCRWENTICSLVQTELVTQANAFNKSVNALDHAKVDCGAGGAL